MSSRTQPTNVTISKANGHPTDTASKSHSGSPFAAVAVSGNLIEIHADGGIWDTVANKFLQPADVKRSA